MNIDDLNDNIDLLKNIEQDDKYFDRSGAMKKAWVDHRESMMRGSYAAHTPEQQAVYTENLREWSESPEGKAWLSNHAKNLWKRPEYREKVCAAMSAALSTPEQSARASAHTKNMWQQPGFKEKRSAAIRAKDDAKWSHKWPEYEKSYANLVYNGTRPSFKGTALRDGHDPHQFRRWILRFKKNNT